MNSPGQNPVSQSEMNYNERMVSLISRSGFFWIAQLLLWTAYFIFDVLVLHRYSLLHINSEPQIYIYPFFYCYFGLPLTLLIKWIMDKEYCRLQNLRFLLLFGLLLPVSLAHVWYLLSLILDQTFGRIGYANPLVDYFWDVFLASLILLVWSTIYLFFKLLILSYQQQEKLGKEKHMAEIARLKTLQHQISPHFLFNGLASLRTLIREDRERAIEMLSGITELMQYSLEAKNKTFVPLKEEIEAVKTYIETESIRFENKLESRIHVSLDLLEFAIPPFIIHPLVENAIKYGMKTSPVPLKLDLSIGKTDAGINVSVINSGQWIEGIDSGMGSGIQNLKERLQLMYGHKHRFDIVKMPEEVRIIMEIGT